MCIEILVGACLVNKNLGHLMFEQTHYGFAGETNIITSRLYGLSPRKLPPLSGSRKCWVCLSWVCSN